MALVVSACRESSRSTEQDDHVLTASAVQPAGACFDLQGCQSRCDTGMAAACLRAARFHHEGWGVPRSPERTKQLDLRACDLGNGAGCEELLERSLVPETEIVKMLVKAVEQYGRSCDARDGESCSTLAALYGMGRGVPADGVKSAELDEHGCHAGFPPACASVLARTRRLHDAAATKRADADLEAASRRACEAGTSGACKRLVTYSSPPYPGPRLPDADALLRRSLALDTRACELGWPEACYFAGAALDENSILHDAEHARLMFARGCQLGDRSQCEKARK